MGLKILLWRTIKYVKEYSQQGNGEKYRLEVQTAFFALHQQHTYSVRTHRDNNL